MSFIDFKSKSKLTPPQTGNLRMYLKLREPDGTFYNSVNYKTLAKTALGDQYLSDGDSDNTNDFLMDYEEDSCIDNTELYPDTLPPGQQTEFGGFFINCGKLKLKSANPPAVSTPVDTPKKQAPKKRKKLVQAESSEGSQRVCKKKAPKNDANAKLDAVLMMLLKGRMKTQDPSSSSSKKNLGINGHTSRLTKNGEGMLEFKHSFVSARPRMNVFKSKLPRKM